MAVKTRYIIRKRALGDVLWIEPIISKLAENSEKLIVYTKYNQLFANYPNKKILFKDKLSFFERILVRISTFLPVLKRIVLNLDDSYESMPNQHFLHAYQKKAGLPIKDIYPTLYLSQHEKDKYLSLRKQQPYVVLHNENAALKNYRKVFGVNWEEVVAHIHNTGFTVYQVGKPEIPIKGTKIIETNIRDLIALLFNASYFIGVDSGPSHIASALQIPSILFFGRVNPDFRHFRKSFKGIILNNSCCYDNDDHDLAISEKLNCKIVGEDGLPPCCFFETADVTASFDLLQKK